MKPWFSGKSSFYLATIVALLVFWIAFNLFRGYYGARPVVVSRVNAQHALFEGPRRSDNSIDYAAAVDQIQSYGITDDQNFLIPVLELMPADDPFAERLRTALANDYPVDLNSNVRFKSDQQIQQLTGKSAKIISHISVEDFHAESPAAVEAKEMLELQKPALDRLLVELDQRPRLFSPLKIAGEDVALVNNRLTVSRQLYQFGVWLQVRSHFYLASREPAKAWRDIRAIFQLSNRVSQGASVMDAKLGVNLYLAAVTQTLLLLNFPWLDKDLLAEIDHDLKGLPDNRHWGNTIDIGERATFLDTYDRVARGEDVLAQLSPELDRVVGMFPMGWVDSGQYADRWNAEVDAIVLAAMNPNEREATRALRKLEAGLYRDVANWDNWFSAAKKVAVGLPPKREATDQALNTMIGIFVPNLNSLALEHEQCLTQSKLIRIGVAARVYEAEHKRLPESFEQLKGQLDGLEINEGEPGEPVEMRWMKSDGGNRYLAIFILGAPPSTGRLVLVPYKFEDSNVEDIEK